MSNDDKREIARLKRLNAELANSLQRCRDVLNRWRSHMAANSNDMAVPDFSWRDEDERQA